MKRNLIIVLCLFSAGLTLAQSPYYEFNQEMRYASRPVASGGGGAPSDYIALWHMDNDWVDTVNANNGTAYGGATFSANSFLGTGCGNFNGLANSYVTTPNLCPATGGLFTVSFWVNKNPVFDLLNSCLSFGGASIIGVGGYMSYPQPYSIALSSAANTPYGTVANTYTVLNDAEAWRYITVTYDKNATPTTAIYKDGIAQTIYAAGTGDIAPAPAVNFGQYMNSVGGYPLKGMIDEVSIFDRALTASEVTAFYLSYLSPCVSPDVTTVGATNIYTFTNSAQFGKITFTDSATCDILVVGGAGGGGQRIGGGGGAGGLIYVTNVTVAAGTYLVQVGQGGAGSTNDSQPGSRGTPSSFLTYPATGGQGGGSCFAGVVAPPEYGRGSGGGAAANGSGAGGSGNYPSRSPLQGTQGGAGSAAALSGGGGGGIGGSGTNGVSTGGHGGSGFTCDISGISTNYAGGGGGAGYPGYSVVGKGQAGGSDGTLDETACLPARVNSGSGGGGGGQIVPSPYTGGHGGRGADGIVIIRYPQ